MNKKSKEAIAQSLGNPDRDFQKDPLTQNEIHAVVHTYSREMLRENLDPDLKKIYHDCVETLRKHLILH